MEGAIDLKKLEEELTFEDNGLVFVVPTGVQTEGDLQIALSNNLTIAFGAAAITLNRSREEREFPLPDPINDERDQCIALIYQIRNAFAHDIAEPVWKINRRYRRVYEVAGLRVDLTDLDSQHFEYKHIHGPGGMFDIRDRFEELCC